MHTVKGTSLCRRVQSTRNDTKRGGELGGKAYRVRDDTDVDDRSKSAGAGAELTHKYAQPPIVYPNCAIPCVPAKPGTETGTET